jgi:hypothetical protein
MAAARAGDDACVMRLAGLLSVVAASTVFVATVGAAPTPVSPAPNSSTTSTHPTFRWKVAPPEVSASITLAKAPTVGANGDFPTRNLVDFDDLQEDQTSWSPNRPLPVGTYWWHVGSVDTTPGVATGKLFTPVAKLTILPTAAAQSFKIQWSGHQFLAMLSLKSNVQQVNVLVQLFAGKHLLGSQRAKTNNFNVDQPTTSQSVFTVPTSVKRGTGLRLVATLTVKGSTAKATFAKTLRAP